jgi:hypothetical protein
MLILTEAGYQDWRIYGPAPGFGIELALSSQIQRGADRRYVEVAIHGTLFEATERLHQLEKGMNLGDHARV